MMRVVRGAILLVAFCSVLAAEAVAQTGSSWFLVAPPPIRDKSALFKAYAANSEVEMRAALDGLPDDEQLHLLIKIQKILTIPTVIARTEALIDAALDTSAPLPTWRQLKAFDSAASCERLRERALESYERDASKVRSSHPEGEDLRDEDLRTFSGRAAARKSRCVPGSAFFLESQEPKPRRGTE
jgi:hypothetical protein